MCSRYVQLCTNISLSQHKFTNTPERQLIFRAEFWADCQMLHEQVRDALRMAQMLKGPMFESERIDVNRSGMSLETIYFFVASSGHWWLVVLEFRTKKTFIVDGLELRLPSNVMKYVGRILDLALGISLEKLGWAKNIRRIKVPKQPDGDSCGVVAICALEYLISRAEGMPCASFDAKVQFNPKEHRIKWLRRVIEHQKHQDIVSVGPVMATVTDSDSEVWNPCCKFGNGRMMMSMFQPFDNRANRSIRAMRWSRCHLQRPEPGTQLRMERARLIWNAPFLNRCLRIILPQGHVPRMRLEKKINSLTSRSTKRPQHGQRGTVNQTRCHILWRTKMSKSGTKYRDLTLAPLVALRFRLAMSQSSRA